MQARGARAGVCRRAARCFIVNDDVALAAAVDADGVHLGEDDGASRGARRSVGPERSIGVSCYDDLARARGRGRGGRRLRRVRQLLSLERQARRAARRRLRCCTARAALGVPVVAIGGITPDNARALSAPAPTRSP